ncbi:unnamed protein product [Rotaria sp. Silwood1]|nr:unnamed protein product [Rotaria sp. Silwood1]
MIKMVERANMDEHHQQLYESFLKYLETTKSLQKFNPNLSAPAYQGLNATPLGLCAFALTTFVASMYLCGVSVPVDASIGVVIDQTRREKKQKAIKGMNSYIYAQIDR